MLTAKKNYFKKNLDRLMYLKIKLIISVYLFFLNSLTIFFRPSPCPKQIIQPPWEKKMKKISETLWWQWWYLPHPSRYSLSPVCENFKEHSKSKKVLESLWSKSYRNVKGWTANGWVLPSGEVYFAIWATPYSFYMFLSKYCVSFCVSSTPPHSFTKKLEWGFQLGTPPPSPPSK